MNKKQYYNKDDSIKEEEGDHFNFRRNDSDISKYQKKIMNKTGNLFNKKNFYIMGKKKLVM